MSRRFLFSIPLLISLLLLTQSISPVSAEPHAGEPLRLIVQTGSLQQPRDVIQTQQKLLTQLHSQGIQAANIRTYHRVFNGFAVTIPASDLPVLERIYGEENIFPDLLLHASTDVSIPLIGANQVWELQDENGEYITGRGVKVAVLDTGINYKHPALGGCLGPGCKVTGGFDFVGDDGLFRPGVDADPMDDCGHGTHVAGIIASNSEVYRGVAYGADLLVYKVLNSNGDGTMSTVLAGIEQAVIDGADIINLSLSAPFNAPGFEPLNQAVNNAATQGVFVVAAAGNHGIQGYGSIFPPASAPGAFAVANINKAEIRAESSSLGPDLYYDRFKPELAAPGSDIWSTYKNGFAQLTGTSMAAPHVSGAAALLLQAHPEWSPADLRSALLNSTKELDFRYAEVGAGKLQVDQALRQPVLVYPAALPLGLVKDGTAGGEFELKSIVETGLDVQIEVTPAKLALTPNYQAAPNVSSIPPEHIQPDVWTFNLAPGEIKQIRLSLNPPPLAASGYYEGAFLITIDDGVEPYRLRVPYTFWVPQAETYLPLLSFDYAVK